MIRILFITLGHLSGGEFTIATEFSKKLDKSLYDICFLTSLKGESYFKKNNIKYITLKQTSVELLTEDKIRNRKVTEELIEEYQPDYVIACDVYTMWYSFSWSGVDMELFEAKGIPFGSFDSYEFGNTNYLQDYYGGYVAELPPLIDKCDFVIRYCPINKYGQQTQKVKYTYLFDEPIKPKTDTISKFNECYRPKGKEKVIFLSNSDWESLNVNRLPALTNLIKWLPDIIYNYMRELGEKITIIHVGATPFTINIKDKNIEYHYFKFLDPVEYDNYLSQSDLFITTNIISSTLVKAVYANVPAIVLQNDKYIDFSLMPRALEQMPYWYRSMASEVKVAYPFRLFPFGWYEFLKVVLDNNEYCNTFIQANLFKKNQVLRLLYLYLYNEEAIDKLKEAQQCYIDKILQLNSPNDVIASLWNIGKK